jgi:hypothetical protein
MKPPERPCEEHQQSHGGLFRHQPGLISESDAPGHANGFTPSEGKGLCDAAGSSIVAYLLGAAATPAVDTIVDSHAARMTRSHVVSLKQGRSEPTIECSVRSSNPSQDHGPRAAS